jgi:predicted nucleotidyltransferase
MNRLQSEALPIAEEFGKRAYLLKEIMQIEDLILFGSVAKRKEDHRDIDILLIHHNQIIEEFKQLIADRKDISDAEKFVHLKQKLLSSGVDIQLELEGTRVLPLIARNIFNVNYMHSDFFRDSEYRALWRAKNCNPDPHYDNRIFTQGFLWNPLTEHYDIPASQRYQIPSD